MPEPGWWHEAEVADKRSAAFASALRVRLITIVSWTPLVPSTRSRVSLRRRPVDDGPHRVLHPRDARGLGFHFRQPVRCRPGDDGGTDLRGGSTRWPVAGPWVAPIGSKERREFSRRVTWYGLVGNQRQARSRPRRPDSGPASSEPACIARPTTRRSSAFSPSRLPVQCSVWPAASLTGLQPPSSHDGVVTLRRQPGEVEDGPDGTTYATKGEPDRVHTGDRLPPAVWINPPAKKEMPPQ